MNSNDNDQSKSGQYWLEVMLHHFEEKMAVVVTRDGQKIFWPIKNLPDDCEVGMKMRLVLRTSKTEQEDRQKLAKAVLNKILKNE